MEKYENSKAYIDQLLLQLRIAQTQLDELKYVESTSTHSHC